MSKIRYLLVLSLVVFGSCEKAPTSGVADDNTYIEIVSITPQAQSVVAAQDTVRASLAYAISAEHQSDFGFRIGILFSSTNPTQTFCTGNCPPVDLTERQDTVATTYALSEIWNDARLQHPVSCYFYLRKYTTDTTSAVIAKTDAVAYSSVADDNTYIEIVSITPQAQAVVSAQDTVRASLAYAISAEHQSDFGFKVGILFSSTDPTQTFCTGNCPPVDLTERQDTVAITYALSEIWNDARLQHPVSCYFYMRKYTTATTSAVIAKTDAVAYKE